MCLFVVLLRVSKPDRDFTKDTQTHTHTPAHTHTHTHTLNASERLTSGASSFSSKGGNKNSPSSRVQHPGHVCELLSLFLSLSLSPSLPLSAIFALSLSLSLCLSLSVSLCLSLSLSV